MCSKIPVCAAADYPDLAIEFEERAHARCCLDAVAYANGNAPIQFGRRLGKRSRLDMGRAAYESGDGFSSWGAMEESRAAGKGTERGTRPGRPPSFLGTDHPAFQNPAIDVEQSGHRPSFVRRHCRIV